MPSGSITALFVHYHGCMLLRHLQASSQGQLPQLLELGLGLADGGDRCRRPKVRCMALLFRLRMRLWSKLVRLRSTAIADAS